MQVSQLMHQPVITLKPEDSLSEAAQLFRRYGIGMLPVCQNSQLCGVVTDRDLVTRGVASGIVPEKCPVRRIMTQCLTCVTPDTDLSAAAYLMARHKLRRLPVVQEGQVIGVLTLADLARSHPHTLEVSQTLAEISKEEAITLDKLES